MSINYTRQGSGRTPDFGHYFLVTCCSGRFRHTSSSHGVNLIRLRDNIRATRKYYHAYRKRRHFGRHA